MREQHGSNINYQVVRLLEVADGLSGEATLTYDGGTKSFTERENIQKSGTPYGHLTSKVTSPLRSPLFSP